MAEAHETDTQQPGHSPGFLMPCAGPRPGGGALFRPLGDPAAQADTRAGGGMHQCPTRSHSTGGPASTRRVAQAAAQRPRHALPPHS